MVDAGGRPMGRFFYWLLLAAVAAFGFRLSAFGAPVPPSGPGTTTVADTVYMADGTSAAGSLIITWPAFVTASGTAVAGGSTTTTLGPSGELSVALVPNAGATPAGVYYTVVYQIGSGDVKTEYWVVPSTSPANLAAVRTTPGSGVAAQPVSVQYVNSALATKADDSAVVHVNGAETISGAKTFATSPSVPSPQNNGDIATKGYVDQSVSNVGAGSYLPTTGGVLTGPLTLPGSPSAPLQAAPKQYVDLGLTSKADLISGVVPANELGTGTANAGSCLLGNGTWGACGSGGGSGNVSTNPGAGVSQNITQSAGTQFSINNLAGIPYVVSSYNWPQGGTPTESCTGGCTGGALVAGTQATVTLTPCPAGIDTSNNTTAPYGVYISGTGTAEAVAVTGGSCTSGAASGTIVFTPGNSHAAGFTVGAANGGNQEAVNIASNTASGPFAVVQEVPAGSSTANYNIYWPVFFNLSKATLVGDGAFWQCFTRSVCLLTTNYMGSNQGHNVIRGLTFESAVNVDGAQISSVAAASGIFTVTTASNHNLVAGDWVILYYSTPAGTQEARVQVLASGLTATQFQYQIGTTATFATSSGFGWVALENAAIEVESDGTKLADIRFQAPAVTGARFHQGVVVGNDQDFVIDGMTVLSGNAFRSGANFVGNVVYIRGDQGAAAVPYIHHLEASMQCGGNGIRNLAGNTMHVSDSVIQGTSQYSIYYANGMNPWEIDNVYYETGNCSNPFYTGGSFGAEAGFVSNTSSALTIQGNAPIGGGFPSFATGGGVSSQRNYYVVAHDSVKGISMMLFIGTAQPATSGTSIPLFWPNLELGGAGTRTWDILVSAGNNPSTAPYTGNAFAVATGVTATCTTTGICSYTDTQGATTPYTVTPTTWSSPSYWFWPGSIILGRGGVVYLDMAGQASSFVPSTYLPEVFAKRCPDLGQNYFYNPVWISCPAGDSIGNANPKVGAQVVQIGAATVMSSGISGALNFSPGPNANAAPRQIITTFDGSPQQTFATPGYVRTGSAKDSFIGTSTAGAAGTQDQSYGAPGGHNFFVNDPGTSASNAKFSILASGASFNTPVSFANGVTLAGITGAVQCLHVSATGVVTGTGSDCGSGGGGGSGTVNSGGASQVAMYSASGAAVSGDSALTDSGTVLNYAGSGGITAASGTFSGNLTVNGQLQVAGPWVVNSPIPGTGMVTAGTGASALGISNDGNFYISTNGGSPQRVATTATSSYFSNLWQEDANDLGEYNGTTAQGLHVYGTYTNSSNYERTGLGWDAADNYFVLRNENAGSGAQRGIGFWIGSAVRWGIDTQSAFKPFMTNSFDVGVIAPAQLVPRTVYAATSFDTLTQGRLNFELCNDSTTGTALNFLAVYNSANPACVVKAGSANTDGVVGIVSNGSGTSGNAVVTYRGYVPCSFDGSTVAGDYVVASTTNAGDCHDAGSTRPAGVQVLGRVESTNSGVGTYGMRASLEAPVNSMAPNSTAVPWIPTSHYSAGINFSTTAGKAIFTGVILTFPKTTSQVTYLVSTADASANTYDIGIYSGTSGGTCTQVAHTGPTAGSTFAPTSSTWKTLSWMGGTVTLQPGRYYLAYTTSCTASCATMGGDSAGMTFAGSSGGANSNVAVTTGGTLPASVTCPADSYTTSSMPNWAIN